METDFLSLRNAVSQLLDVDLSCNFVFKIPQKSQLKKAYRQKALLYHPDRKKYFSLSFVNNCEEIFKTINNSFEILLPFANEKKEVVVKKKNPVFVNKFIHKHPDSQKDNYKSKAYSPKRSIQKMRLGQFLYSKNIISYETLLKALAWQSTNRPICGKIAVSFNFFNQKDIVKIICSRQKGEKFLETAVRLKLITRFQQNAVIGKQKSFGYPIGEYFIVKNILSKTDLERCVKELGLFNLKAK